MRNTKSGLTATIVFQASSANYGESLGNVASLKKLTRGDGQQYTYISRQAMRYNMIQELGENLAPLEAQGSGDKKVIQFSPNATIENSPEIDLFGYMRTEKSKNASVRSAKVRLSNAISQEPYAGDTDFLTNLGLATRLNQEKHDDVVYNNIAQSEIQQSYYCYTVNIDLDQIGIDANDDIELDDTEKARRVNKLLTTIQYLYRDIRGRREDLKPLFIVGGIYDIKNPIFENVVQVHNNNIDIDAIKSVLSDEMIKNDTEIGMVDNMFNNDAEIKQELPTENVAQFMTNLKHKVDQFYK